MRTNFDPTMPMVIVDVAGLESALLNILGNSRDAMPDGGFLSVTTELRNFEESFPPVKAGHLKAGVYAQISVSDTGCGMAREVVDHAFEPFYTTKSRHKGTGLGLAMVYAFIIQSGGTIQIYSEPKYGTTVAFSLPIVGRAAPASLPASEDTLAAKQGGTVLIVDDEGDLIEIAMAYLEELGYIALQANDAANALMIVGQLDHIDLLITDIFMPGDMNGAELAVMVRAMRPAVRIIFCSGFPADALVARNIALADGPLLRKPYERGEFVAAVQQAMDTQREQSAALSRTQHICTFLRTRLREEMTKRQRILVVDDEAEVGQFIVDVCQAMGLECYSTNKASTFLAALTPETTLIFLDLLIPDIDGIELLRILTAQQCKANIVLMSGIGMRVIETAQDMAEALGLSVVGCLQKPFGVQMLETMLNKQITLSTPSHFTQKSPRLIEDADLQRAIVQDEFVVHYQPTIELSTGEVVGVEALVRWLHPEYGLVFPDDFISRLEASKLIDNLGWLVANRGLTEVSLFSDDRGRTPMLSLNVSALTLHDLQFPDTMMALLNRHSVAANRVILEITESGLINELASTLDVLTRLRMRGIKLSIDDFGTGYSMMQQLRRIPSTELKIDRGFVQNLDHNHSDRVLVQKTIEIGHELEMTVVAEGVETEQQLEFLRENHCDIVQGYLFTRPLPPLDLVSWLKTYRSSA